MTKTELLAMLIKNAREYRGSAWESVQRNQHMNDCTPELKPDQRLVDALLVDFLNFVGGKQCIDLALYASDLRKLDGE